MGLVDVYFEALKKGDFETFARFCKIKRGLDQSSMMFVKDEWTEEQESFYRNSRAGRLTNNDPQFDVVVKARRIGMTTLGCLQDYFFAIRNPGRDVMFVAQDEATRIEGLEIIRNCHDNLKEWGDQLGVELVPDFQQDNVRTLKFTNGSRILSEVSKANRAAAKKAGRGKTISRLHCTEVSFWTFPAETMLSLLEAASNAKEILVESTPNGATGYFYELVQRATPYKMLARRHRLNTKWRLHFFPWYEHSAYRLKELPLDFEFKSRNKWEHELIEHHGVDQLQLAWWREKVEDHGLMAILQEYPNDLVSCFRASGATFLDEDDLAWLANNHCNPTAVEDIFGVPMAIWERPQGSSRYIIGVDMGYGRGQDYSAFCVISCDGGHIVATGASNEMDTSSFARALAKIGHQYNNALIAVEHQAAGHGCISDLQTKEEYSHLFKHKEKEYYGFNTTAISRVEMFYHIQSYIAERRVLPDVQLINELKNVVIHKVGSINKPAAIKGANDDRVMAFGIALSVWMSVPHLVSTGYISISKTKTAEMFRGGPKRLGKQGSGFL